MGFTARPWPTAAEGRSPHSSLEALPPVFSLDLFEVAGFHFKDMQSLPPSISPAAESPFLTSAVSYSTQFSHYLRQHSIPLTLPAFALRRKVSSPVASSQPPTYRYHTKVYRDRCSCLAGFDCSVSR